MREFQRSFQPIQLQVHQEQTQDDAVDWGSKEWGTHRFHIRQLLNHAIDQLQVKDKAAVLGAGTHGDVDLPELADHFMQVTVLDTEPNALEEIIESSGGVISGKLKSVINVDYTCLDQVQFYETWEEMLLNQAPASEMAAYIKDCAFRVRHREAFPQWKKSFSLVVSSSVHTQLFYIHALTQFAGYAEQYAELEVRQVIEALAYLRNSLITDYNKLLMTLLKPDGKLVLWSDMIRLDEHNENLLESLYQLKTEEQRVRFLFQAFGQYGMEPAVLGMKDIHDHLQHDNQMFKCWVWMTGEDKKYITAGFSGSFRG
ncbi:hypothetical protein [Paenibacillus sp. UNC451MF]|uniref:hypothetical protein n=1 Tax=Paenibacillus sp. UNC451MF TaxID=1449063 RepID=UPI00068A3808|nr:hypothetical protein [Paenibacillus sp. UNC451MF]